MATVTEIKHCRMCESPQLRKVLPLKPTPVGDYYLRDQDKAKSLEAYPLDVYQCANCGHVQLRAIVDPEYLYRDYIYTTSSSLGLPDHFREYARTVSQKLQLPGGSLVVEIGSNDGTLLRAFKELGFRVLGIDPARDIAAKATENGTPTLGEFFTPALAEKILGEHGAASLVIANNVMANVPSPFEVASGVKTLIGDSGIFVFETGYLRYLAEDVVFDNIYHEHIDYYSIAPLLTFFEKLEMKVFDVDVSASKGSSIRVYSTAKTNGRAVASIVEELAKHEATQGYNQAFPYEQLGAKIAETREELQKMLGEWKTEGKRVAGYGASVGVTTVLYEMQLEGLIDYLIDDNPSRQGLFSPGLGIEVKDPQALQGEERPDVVLIIAWRYAEPIMAKNTAYLDDGGCFLKFLPEIELIEQTQSLA